VEVTVDNLSDEQKKYSHNHVGRKEHELNMNSISY